MITLPCFQKKGEKMTKKYIFQENILGSINGIDVKEFKKNEIIEKQDLSEELFNAWLKREVIVDVDKKNNDVNNSGKKEEKDAEGTTETGETDVNNSVKDGENADGTEGNLDDIPVPDNADTITNEEAKKLLIEEIKKVLEAEPIDTDKLKDYGTQLEIKNMAKTVNPDTIIKKVKEYLLEIDNEQKDAE